jgi:hypothetical protein
MFLPANPVALVLCAALIGWTASRIVPSHERGPHTLLAFGVWCCALLAVYSQALSAVTQFHWPGLLMLSAAVALIAWLRRDRGGRESSRPDVAVVARLRSAAREDGWALAILLVPLAVYGLWQAWLILVSSETCGDNAAYHLPRLGYWLQHQSVAPFLSNDPRSGTFPPNGNILHAFPMLFLRTERLSGFAQLAALFGTGVAIFAIARDLGWSRLASVAAACCWFFIPSALGQANVSLVDVISAFFTTAAVAFAVASVRRPGASTWTCLAAAALAVGTKTQVVLGVVPAVAVASCAAWRAGRRPTWLGVGGGLALVFALAGVGLVQNQRLFGSPFGFASVTWIVSDPGWGTLVKNLEAILAPLDPDSALISPYWVIQDWSLAAAFSAWGLGLVWLAALLGALGHLAWRAVRRTPAPNRSEMLYVAGAVGFMIATLFVMRHQPTLTRFLLPAAAVLTPLIAPALETRLARPGWRRAVTAVVLSGLGAWVLVVWSVADLRGRTRPPGSFDFKPVSEMCDGPFVPLAQAFEELARRHGVPRVGIVTSHYSIQRLLFGPRFSNVLVPLSYAPPRDLLDLDRLDLDAVWLEAAFQRLQLFAQPFAAPRVDPVEGRVSKSPLIPDNDYFQAAAAAVVYPSYEDLALKLARRGSGWGVLFADSHGILFSRQHTTADALAVMDVSSPNGIRTVEGVVYSRLGDQPVSVTAFAGRSGSVAWEASFLPGGDRVGWPRRRVIVRDAASNEEVGSVSPAERFVVPVKGGVNRFKLRLRSESDGAPADRLGRLSMAGLRLSWIQ